MHDSEYEMIGKGRKKQEKLGGGVAFLHRKEGNLKVDEIDVGNSAMSEDVLAARVECLGQNDVEKKFIVIVVYMTVEDELELENLNETVAEGRVTWNARNQESAIDYVLVNGKMRESVARMWIDEEGKIDIVSDHNMLVVDCMMWSKTIDQIVMGSYMFEPEYEVDEQVLAEPEVQQEDLALLQNMDW
ncbi:hypothetical protein GWK47_013130 [Chionoecetes opilio]|uniref:Uncharacterized protein n=1 Tax=Chionoecetes opilio TaxID=41210 RepID=A0A8J5CLI5_CHIOP|nr:hypothetical protein GWK47_013130 [Chionoecetes opilio]